MVYRFIQNNHKEFGMRWLLRKFNLSPNAYYNFLKNKKAKYRQQKHDICKEIKTIYHDTDGRLGHRNMKIFLARKEIYLSKTTVHQYMNKELGLTSIVKRKRPIYKESHAHKV